MASTIAPVYAFDFCKTLLKKMPLEDIQVRILDDVNKMMWMAAPWRWSVSTLTAITLTANTSDYTLSPPADFLYILHSFITDGASPTNHLEVVPSLPASGIIKGTPQYISYQGSNTFRISPNPGTFVSTAIPTPPTKQIFSWYKKIAPVITASNQMTAGTLVFDDEYFPIYEQGVLWLSYLYGDDARAGNCNFDSSGRAQFTGARATFEAGLQGMREREPLPSFIPPMTPDVKATK